MPASYVNTYWNDKGRNPKLQKALETLVPAVGEVSNAQANPALESYRIAANCYYDLYNNGLGNRKAEFRKVFGFSGPKHHYDELTQELVDKVETTINYLMELAAIEQHIWVDGRLVSAIDSWKRATKT